MSIEKLVNYAASNSYSTLNELTPKTRRVWMVFHGQGSEHLRCNVSVVSETVELVQAVNLIL